LQPDDASNTYLQWFFDSDVIAFLEARFSPPQTLEQLRDYIQKISEDPDSLLIGIFKKESGKHIGNIKLGPINHHHKVATIGFLIGEKNDWGKGFASTALRMVSEYAFRTLDLKKITAGCYAGNEGSRRALLKAGFKEEGIQESQWQFRGERQNGLLFGKINPLSQAA